MAETQEVPLDQLPMDEYNKARDEGKETVEKPIEEPVKEEKAEIVEGEETKQEPKPEEKHSPKVQGRIDRFKKIAAEAEERAAAAERKAQELEAKVNGTTKKEEPKPRQGEPKQEDYTDYERYLVDKAKWEMKQELQAEREAEEAEEENAKVKETFDAHNERVVEARAKYEDFDDVVTSAVATPWKDGNKADVQASQAFQIALFESPLSGEILYHYGKHPDELLKLGGLSPTGVQKAVGRLEAKLEAELGTQEETEEVEEVKPAKRESKAPLPIKPVSGGATKSSIPLDKMDPIAFNKAREAGRTH